MTEREINNLTNEQLEAARSVSIKDTIIFDSVSNSYDTIRHFLASALNTIAEIEYMQTDLLAKRKFMILRSDINSALNACSASENVVSGLTASRKDYNTILDVGIERAMGVKIAPVAVQKVNNDN